MQANGVVVWYMDTKVLYISKNTALMNRWEVNKKMIYYLYDPEAQKCKQKTKTFWRLNKP